MEGCLIPTIANPSAPVSGRGNETILLVDDDELIRKFVARVLAGSGYAVLSAASPAEALRLCAERRESIDLMLTDVVMPGMLGDELARRLETARPDMKVIFMSGYTEESIIQRAVMNGAAFIQKPMTLELIVRRVREVLDAPRKTQAG